MSKKHVQSFIAVLIILVIAYSQNFESKLSTHKIEDDNHQLKQVIQNKLSSKIITLKAKVIKILADDSKGSRHQKFIVKVANNTLLITHNIDLADRVPIQIGDVIRIKGEYEWNQQGGLIHWTHKDKLNKHPNGWIEHNKKKYQ
jgi:hypothetical protein